MRRLVVTADDFGASEAINEAVERAHRDGVLTAASLMVAEPAAGDAVARARRLPNLAVGLHVALTNARPMLPPERVPLLVERDGRFGGRLVRFGVRAFAMPAVRAQLRAEIRAQFEAFAATGLALDHVDAHNHIHVHPTVLGTILEVGRAFGVRAVRVPIEPFSLTAAGIGNALVMGPWTALMRARLRRAGITTNDAVFGLNETGRVDEAAILAMLARVPDGTSELYVHPASAHSGYARREELDALLSPRVREAIAERGIALVRFGDAA